LPVRFTGYLHGEDLISAYGQADVFVFPSTTDTFGDVVLEAQASGLPVIVSNYGGPQENILEGRTGIRVREESAQAYAEAMIELARDPARLRDMQCEARAYAQSRSLEQAFTAQWRLYQEWHSAHKAAS
jgi:glycosyltransferase involved in cell wall biosynthesis